ncbi:MAG: aldehyde dehydrogenase family protein, partial [Candidatus Omnitrophica bacterium]|nr:aldehyde dehydrogenase family protein [Candidatus Omnitrophota bacterium]
AMIPLWMAPVAIACGNCFVLKPSERTPLTANRLGELMLKSGLPEGVLSILHGGKDCVNALLEHPMVQSISFVGSTPVARHVYSTGCANGKRVQAAGGAKNHVIVMPDAPLEATVNGVLNSAFGCAGQRCMAGSVAVAVGEAGDEFVERFQSTASKMVVGRTDIDSAAEMGPVITAQHRSRVFDYIGIGEREGANVRMDGRKVSIPDAPNGFFVGPTLIDHVQPETRIAKEEIFGPVLSVIRAKSLEEALAIGEKCEFGNGATLFTKSGWAAREFKHRFNAGMIGINVGVPAPLAWFPFTGWNGSFFGDLHIQGTESVAFYTQQRIVMNRWMEDDTLGSEVDPVWRHDRIS